MHKVSSLIAVLFLSACGGGGAGIPQETKGLPDAATYLAQSAKPDGNVATPLHDVDKLTYRRFDYTRPPQIEDSFLTSAGAVTTWSYPPYGPFIAAHGDGGEREILANGIGRIVATQDGSRPGVQVFVVPWTVIGRFMPCRQGWTPIGAGFGFVERGCRDTITFPASGFNLDHITADTIVTEHGDAHAVERIFLSKGWGRLAWQAFAVGGTPADPSRCPDFGWNAMPGYVLTDCRVVTNLLPADGSLTGLQEWR